MNAPGPPVTGEEYETARRRQRYVLIGLLLTFLGIGLTGVEFPTAPAALGRLLPILGFGMLALWIGGILLGNVMRPFWRPRRSRP